MKRVINQKADGVTGAAWPVQIQNDDEKNAIQFVIDYYNSPGFNERFNNLSKSVLPKYYANSVIRAIGSNDKIELLKNPYVFKSLRRDPYFINNAYFDRAHTVWLGPIDFSKNNPSFIKGDYGQGYDDVIAHEMGHAIDASIGKTLVKPPIIENGDTLRQEFPMPYSDLYPVFRNSAAYKNAVSKMPKYEREIFLKYPSETGEEIFHDARPSESYADLIRFRYQLNKLGIFDSRKKGLTFEKKHLEEFRKKYKSPSRLFNNFSDDDIIWMMNNVAQNSKLKIPNINFMA